MSLWTKKGYIFDYQPGNTGFFFYIYWVLIKFNRLKPNFMKMYLTVLVLTVLVMACSKPECENKNPVLSQNYFDSEAYKRELVRQIQAADPGKIDYWFDMYVKRGMDEYIDVHVQGAELCAEAHIKVTDWTKLKGIRETGGLSYHGAKLTGLKFDIEQDSIRTEFIYKDIDSVID
jgi:hypothetical protein